MREGKVNTYAGVSSTDRSAGAPNMGTKLRVASEGWQSRLLDHPTLLAEISASPPFETRGVHLRWAASSEAQGDNNTEMLSRNRPVQVCLAKCMLIVSCGEGTGPCSVRQAPLDGQVETEAIGG
jgi:hypothetical protein